MCWLSPSPSLGVHTSLSIPTPAQENTLRLRDEEKVKCFLHVCVLYMLIYRSPLNAARLCVRSLASEGFYVTQCTFICVHAGLKGQLWFWVLLGKTTILLLSLASLAVKHKTE